MRPAVAGQTDAATSAAAAAAAVEGLPPAGLKRILRPMLEVSTNAITSLRCSFAVSYLALRRTGLQISDTQTVVYIGISIAGVRSLQSQSLRLTSEAMSGGACYTYWLNYWHHY